MPTLKARQDLRSKFVRNAIPTEQDFKDLIDGQLNQKDDGIFRNPGEPLSIVAGSDAQKRTLRLYGDDSGAAPDWLISLNPGQDPNNAATNRRGLGIANAEGTTRLFIDVSSGNIGIGTTNPQQKLSIAGGLNIDAADANDNTLANGLIFGSCDSGEGILSKRTQGGNHCGLDFYTGGQARLSIDNAGNVGIGRTPEPTAGKLQLDNEPGDKLILYNAGPADRYGLGFNNTNLNAFIPANGSFSIRNYGFNGTEVFKVNGNGGTLSLLADNLFIDQSWAPSPTIDGTTYESKATIRLNGNSSLCLCSPGGGKAALVVDGPIISTESGANFAGNVGIGTTNPRRKLSIAGGMNIDEADASDNGLANGLVFGRWDSGEGISSKRTQGGNYCGLDFYTRGQARLSIDNAGNVGIGTTNPQRKLSIAGGMNIDDADATDNGLANGLVFGHSNSGEGISSKRTAGGNQYGLDFYTGRQARLSIDLYGKVNIGDANNGYLSLGEWTLCAEGENLRLIYNNAEVARFLGSSQDIFMIFMNRDGLSPRWYFNKYGNFNIAD